MFECHLINAYKQFEVEITYTYLYEIVIACQLFMLMEPEIKSNKVKVIKI